MDTISSSSHLFVKLVWNSAVGSEDSLDVQMALYKTSLVKNFLRNVFSEAQSCQSFAQESYDKKYSQWKNSLKSSNDETNKTKGSLKRILAPDCNAYRLRAIWMDEDITSTLPIQDQSQVLSY